MIKVPQKAARDEYLRQTAEFFLDPVLYIDFCTVHREDGYIVNRSNEWELHHAWCDHIQRPIQSGQNVLSYDKFGALDPSLLRAAALADHINLTEDCYCMQA